MKKKIHKEELLYEVVDKNLGTDLHLKKVSFVDGVTTDWNVESLLIAEELAEKKGFELPHFPDNLPSWEYSYYCKINGITYYVTSKRRSIFGDIHYKIHKI